MTLILFWLFTYPVFSNPDYAISINALGLDIQPNRMLFLILAPFFVWMLVKQIHLHIYENQPLTLKLNGFEVFMLTYIGINIFTILSNYNQIGSRTVIKECTDLTTFALVFFTAKRYISQKDLYLLSTALLIFGLLSSVIGLYQFIVNPDLFRVGSSRTAFGNYIRANGLFSNEYNQGIFLVITFILCWEAFPEVISRFFISAIFIAGVFVTMHRLSWIAMTIVFVLALFLAIRKNLPMIVVTLLIVSAVALSVRAGPFSQPAVDAFVSDLLTGRVEDDTLTVRMRLNSFAFSMISKYPLGVGEFDTPIYNKEANIQGMPFDENGAFVIHNGFLSAAVRTGILGALVFTLYLLSALFFFLQRASLFGKQWYIPLAILLVYALFNTSNDFSFWGTQVNIFIAFLMGALTGQIERRMNASVAVPAIEQFQASPVYHIREVGN